jgi:hypothetical protein
MMAVVDDEADVSKDVRPVHFLIPAISQCDRGGSVVVVVVAVVTAASPGRLLDGLDWLDVLEGVEGATANFSEPPRFFALSLLPTAAETEAPEGRVGRGGTTVPRLPLERFLPTKDEDRSTDFARRLVGLGDVDDSSAIVVDISRLLLPPALSLPLCPVFLSEDMLVLLEDERCLFTVDVSEADTLDGADLIPIKSSSMNSCERDTRPFPPATRRNIDENRL